MLESWLYEHVGTIIMILIAIIGVLFLALTHIHAEYNELRSKAWAWECELTKYRHQNMQRLHEEELAEEAARTNPTKL